MAVKMQGEFEGDFNTVFVEVQGAEADDVEAFALKKKWLGTSAMWTTERPMRTNARGIPNCVVLDGRGQVVLMGHPMRLHKDIEALISAEKRQRGKTPDDLPKELSRAWKAFAKDKFAEAVREAEEVAQSSSAAAELVEQARTLATEIRARAAARVERVARMMAAGCYADAKSEADDLVDQLGDLEPVGRARELVAQLDDRDLEPEIKAEKALARLEQRLYAKGVDATSSKLLEQFAKKFPGTKAAARADRLARLART